ncbi:MAG: bifunctional hydroxymethylpyrimidine kinase/phosphomethylpyrimidine kinase, partial [Thermoleophilia bacterium]|nr:bifunctional hydroxymethylpyrimidine kinase/phosphomethylpyrimidine kinase [Thermoleophilia bacterium]
MSGRRQAELRELLDRVARLRILVVGDVMLDEYRIGEVERISPEAPVPIVRVREERIALGGAGNVARNLVALGAAVELVGSIGRDREGERVEEQARCLGLATEGLVAIPDRPTTHKLRVVARAQQMLRLDREHETPLPAEARARLEAAVFARLPQCDAVVLADYDKGVFADGLAHAIVAAARARGIFVGADPKRELQRFRGASLVKPNLAEACAAVGFRVDDFEGRRRLLEKLAGLLSGAEVVVTRGRDGATVLGRDGRVFDVPTRAVAVFDVQGAGDTAMAALVASRVAGASLVRACAVANAAAAVAVSKLGTAAVSRAELEARFAESIDDAW